MIQHLQEDRLDRLFALVVDRMHSLIVLELTVLHEPGGASAQQATDYYA